MPAMTRWLAVLAIALAPAGTQNIVVDAAPSHAVNSFSPPRALGGATKEDNERHPERLLTDGVTRELPAMIPVAVLYTIPEDYAALYLPFAKAIHVGSMMTAGAAGTYYFHYIANPGRGCGGGGGFLPIDGNNRVRYYPPQYLGAQVITNEWAQPVDKIHKLYKVTSDVKDPNGNILVTAYALERPDGHRARGKLADATNNAKPRGAGFSRRRTFSPAKRALAKTGPQKEFLPPCNIIIGRSYK